MPLDAEGTGALTVALGFAPVAADEQAVAG